LLFIVAGGGSADPLCIADLGDAISVITTFFAIFTWRTVAAAIDIAFLQILYAIFALWQIRTLLIDAVSVDAIAVLLAALIELALIAFIAAAIDISFVMIFDAVLTGIAHTAFSQRVTIGRRTIGIICTIRAEVLFTGLTALTIGVCAAVCDLAQTSEAELAGCTFVVVGTR
jgi:hypothetical protein